MRAWEIGQGFGLEQLRRVERPEVGTPSEGLVRIRMRAASLNYRDLLMIRGHYNPRQPLPLVPGSDGVGEVIAVGPGVQRVTVGQRVCPIFSQGWLSGPPSRAALATTLGGPLDGVLQEEMLVPAEALVVPPDSLTDAEAACLPCAMVTAYNALVEQGQLRAGQTVLVQGTGGVSIAALQIARALGARVMATSSRTERLERLVALGAEHTVNYRENPSWGKAAREWTGGAGVDHVVEVGGADTLEQSLRAVATGGQVSVIGVLSGVKTELALTRVLMHQVRLQGIFVGSRQTFEGVNALVEREQIRPLIDREFPVDALPEALDHLAHGRHFGKVVLRF